MEAFAIAEAIIAGVQALTPLGAKLAVLAGANAEDVQKGVDVATKIENALDPLALEIIKQGAAHTDISTVPTAPPADAGTGIVAPAAPPANQSLSTADALASILAQLKSMDERLKKVESFHA